MLKHYFYEIRFVKFLLFLSVLGMILCFIGTGIILYCDPSNSDYPIKELLLYILIDLFLIILLTKIFIIFKNTQIMLFEDRLTYIDKYKNMTI